ncbi:UNVERIFIED_CONTAM: hypothetical protein FKN15_044769 [Acipenser sinensis]
MLRALVLQRPNTPLVHTPSVLAALSASVLWRSSTSLVPLVHTPSVLSVPHSHGTSVLRRSMSRCFGTPACPWYPWCMHPQCSLPSVLSALGALCASEPLCLSALAPLVLRRSMPRCFGTPAHPCFPWCTRPRSALPSVRSVPQILSALVLQCQEGQIIETGRAKIKPCDFLNMSLVPSVLAILGVRCPRCLSASASLVLRCSVPWCFSAPIRPWCTHPRCSLPSVLRCPWCFAALGALVLWRSSTSLVPLVHTPSVLSVPHSLGTSVLRRSVSRCFGAPACPWYPWCMHPQCSLPSVLSALGALCASEPLCLSALAPLVLRRSMPRCFGTPAHPCCPWCTRPQSALPSVLSVPQILSALVLQRQEGQIIETGRGHYGLEIPDGPSPGIFDQAAGSSPFSGPGLFIGGHPGCPRGKCQHG